MTTLAMPRHADAAVPVGVLDALFTLNGHARAFGSGRKAIYAYKTLAATKLGLRHEFARYEFIEWQGKCRDCDGTGRYWHWSGDRADHCWKCNSTGTAKLRFLETTLPDGRSWHHPWNAGGSSLAELAGVYKWDGEAGRPRFYRGGKEIAEVWWRPNSWHPNMPSQRLPPAQAAALLNVVEPWILADWPSVEARWRHDTAKREIRRYRLDLERVGDRCWYCQSTDVTCGLRVTSGVLEWSAPVCAEHQHQPLAFWPKVLPEWAEAPAVHEWRQRHESLGYDPGEWRW